MKKKLFAAAIFLIFPTMSFVAMALNRRETTNEPSAGSSLFGHAARVGAALPLLFSIYLAAVPAYGARYGVLFGFLFCVVVGLYAVAIFQGPLVLHLVGAISTLTSVRPRSRSHRGGANSWSIRSPRSFDVP